jgi:predicted ATP-dependent serine protease
MYAAYVFCQLGVFEMSESGLQAVLNPSEMFLTEHASDSEILAGLAVAVVLDGSRTFAVEVQVLHIAIVLEPVIYLPLNTLHSFFCSCSVVLW